MDRGVNIVILIALTLISVSIVIGVLFIGLSQGKEVAALSYQTIMKTDEVGKLEAVQTFNTWENKGMPIAACYNLVKSTPELIVSLKCNICGQTTTGANCGDCLLNHLHGRVKLILTEETSGGTYTAVLSVG